MISLGKQSGTSLSSHGSPAPRDRQVGGHSPSAHSSPGPLHDSSNNNSISGSNIDNKQANNPPHHHRLHRPHLPHHHHSRNGNDNLIRSSRSSPVLQHYPDQQRRRRALHQLELDAYPEQTRPKHRRKSHHRTREGHLHVPRAKKQLAVPGGTMNLIPTRSSEREKEREGGNGLLRPIITQTSTVGSEGIGSVHTGSRKGSLASGGFRKASVTMEDMETEKVKRKKGEESLRSSLSSIATLSTEITRRLDYTYYNLLEKLASLQSTVTSFQELSDLTSQLQTDFENETSHLDSDSRKQIEELKGTDSQLKRIEAIETRMKAGRDKVDKLEKRLHVVRDKIDGWERREGEWQARVSRRLRILWAVMGTLFIMFLAASVAQRWPSTPGPLHPETSSRVEMFTNESLGILSAEGIDPSLPKGNGHDDWDKTAVNLQGDYGDGDRENANPAMGAAAEEEGDTVPEVHDPIIRVFDEL